MLQSYTAAGAYAEFEESRKGTLGPGKLADIVIWSSDIFALPPEQVKDATIRLTMLGGRVVYQAEERP